MWASIAIFTGPSPTWPMTFPNGSVHTLANPAACISDAISWTISPSRPDGLGVWMMRRPRPTISAR